MRVRSRSSAGFHFSAAWKMCRTWTQQSISGFADDELHVIQSDIELREPHTYHQHLRTRRIPCGRALRAPALRRGGGRCSRRPALAIPFCGTGQTQLMGANLCLEITWGCDGRAPGGLGAARPGHAEQARFPHPRAGDSWGFPVRSRPPNRPLPTGEDLKSGRSQITASAKLRERDCRLSSLL